MEDYEYYSVDPIDEYHTEEALAFAALGTAELERIRQRKKIFTPTHQATIPGLIFPLDAFIFGDAVFTRCKTVVDLEATLLKR